MTELPDNPNYEIAVSSGSTEMIIRRRDLSVKVENSFGFFGDDSFGAALAISGDGFAPIDDPQSVFQVTSLEDFDRNSRSGYYLLDSFESDEARYNITFEPGVLTILPRPVGLQISGLSRDFDSVEDLNAFQSEESRVVPAEVTNLRPGDTIDDAFPIIRYQIVDAEDAVPQLPVQPTAETVEVPDVDALVNDDSLVASGVRLKASVSPGSGSGVTRSGDLSDAAEGFIDRFITVLDGFDTERDYVLTSVDNGFASFKLPSTPQEETETEYVYSEGGDIGYIRIGSPLTRLRPGPRIEMPDRPEITISGPNDPPPTLDSLFGGDDFEIGIEMIMDYVNRFMDGNEAYVFEEGSLFYEITRSTSGSKEDITPFRVRRFFERNADNPDLLNFLAVPLAEYSEAFLEKDSSTYTEAESEFAELLSDHLEFTRDKVAARMEENRKAWAARENETPPNMVDMFGKDVPWDEFMSDAAGDYVTELLEAKAAGAVAGGALGGGAAAAGTAAVAGALFPNSIGLGAAALGVKTTLTAGAAAAGPAVIVAATITGSIARGIQVFENEERKQFYMDFQNSVGQSISVDSFSLSSDSENEANLNKTILTGAITGMLYSG